MPVTVHTPALRRLLSVSVSTGCSLHTPPRRCLAPPTPWTARATAPFSETSGRLYANASASTGSDDVPWSEGTRTAVTDALVRGFLSTSGKARRDDDDQRPPKRRRPDHDKGPDGRKKRPAEKNDAAAAAASADVSAQARVVGHLLAGGFDEALLAATPTHTLNWAVKTLGRQGRLDLAEQLFHWMRLRGSANEHSFVKLCEACEGARAPARAVLTWRNLQRMAAPFALQERSAAALLKCFRAVGDLPGALRILEELKNSGAPLNQYAFNVVVRAAADAGDADAALEIVTALRHHPGAYPDARTFSALMAAVVAAGRWSRTAAVHKMVEEAGVVPDPPLYLQIMAGYAACARPEAAEAVLDGMSDTGAWPGRPHWNALLSAYAQAGRYEGCWAAYDRMVNGAGLRPDGYTAVALLHAGAAAQGGVSAAARVLALMQAHEIHLTVETGTALIACCRHAPSEAGERRRSVEFAAGVLGMLRAAGVAPNTRTYNSLMAVQADAGDWAGVRATLGALEAAAEVDPDEATFGIALGAFQQAGWFRECEQIEALRETWRTLNPRR